MYRLIRFAIAPLALLIALCGPSAFAQQDAPRIALVIGEANYQAGALATPANDAGLIASTLQQDGFSVVGARDLDQDSIRRAFRAFLDKARAAGPHAIAFVYLSGYGLQYNGVNYLAPVEAHIGRSSDVPIDAVRISDFTRALSGIPLRARIVVLDAARANPFVRQGEPLAGGLALVRPDHGELIAFNAAPGTIGPTEQGPYGAYAQALAAALAQPGLPIADAFAQVRLQVNEQTNGVETPWDASALSGDFDLVPPQPGAPPPLFMSRRARDLRQRPMQDLTPAEAYSVALETDTLTSYETFLRFFPDDPLARRVRALLAARREALTWEETVRAGTADAYWSYLRRYPHGPHYWDARRRLRAMAQAETPPRNFQTYDYQDVPPPPPEETVFIDRRPVIVFEERDYPPPPPPPVWFVLPARRVFFHRPPPHRPTRPGVLPTPIAPPPGRDQRVTPGRNPRVAPARPIPLPTGVKPHQAKPAAKFVGGPTATGKPLAPQPAAHGPVAPRPIPGHPGQPPAPRPGAPAGHALPGGPGGKPLPGRPVPNVVPLQPVPHPAPLKPAPHPIPVRPAPHPVPVRPAPHPIPVRPAPHPAPVRPAPHPAPVRPAPHPVPVRPAPHPAPPRPAPHPVPVRPAPHPAPPRPAPHPAPPRPAPHPGACGHPGAPPCR